MNKLKTIALSISLIGLMSFTNIESIERISIKSEIDNCEYGQCQAIAKSTGNRCKHCVSKKGDLYCWQHD